MLLLSRKVGQNIVIGDAIHITVVAIQGDRVRIGVIAPTDAVVDRKEVHDKRTNVLEGSALPPALISPSDDVPPLPNPP